MRLTSLALLGIAAGGTFAIRLLAQTDASQSWWVEGSLGFLVVASLVGLWVRSVNQNSADRIAHDQAINAIHQKHAEAMQLERAYHRDIIAEIAKEKAAAVDALLSELRERIEDLEVINKGSNNGGSQA